MGKFWMWTGAAITPAEGMLAACQRGVQYPSAEMAGFNTSDRIPNLTAGLLDDDLITVFASPPPGTAPASVPVTT